MKKLVLMVMSLILALSLCACGASDPADNSGNPDNTENTEAQVSEFNIGETWTVDGQWSFVVNSVTATEDRNEFSDKTPAVVYVVDYSYTNIGYKDSNGIMDGLFFVVDSTIVDSAGVMGYSYPGDVSKYASETPVGATCNAQACIGVDNAGTFKLYVSQYDGNGIEQNAVFVVSVPES